MKIRVMGMSLAPQQSIAPQSALTVSIAKSDQEIEQALRLRYEVFVEEESKLQLTNINRLESDPYDSYCDHLIVKDEELDRVIGTYRLLPGPKALSGIGFYSETEFDLSSMQAAKPNLLELGRSCVAPAYRSGRAIQMLWEGIAHYINEGGYSHLIGCASVCPDSEGQLNDMYTMLVRSGTLTYRHGIQPHPANRIDRLQLHPEGIDSRDAFHAMPPLMKGYYRLGAEIAGDPAYDPAFETVDFLIVLDTSKVARKYRKKFLKSHV